jgi:hypothetical protein
MTSISTLSTLSKATMNPISKTLIAIIKQQHEKETKLNIWENSEFKQIRELENNNVGVVGEQFVQQLCDMGGISAAIDGTQTKESGGGEGDGVINGRSVEIKCARAGTGKTTSFQHELGEKPWMADYMIFVDIAPTAFFLTIFPNFTEEQYRSCCKCVPYIPTRAFCHRKKTGSFKFDTSPKLYAKACSRSSPNTLKWTLETEISEMKVFIERIIV